MLDELNRSGSVPNLSSGKRIAPGPYKATQAWNEITHEFYEGMPRKRSRRGLKAYDDCFTASSAIDFLHKSLKENHNFGKEVTRTQTMRLLRKFLRLQVIEDVYGKSGNENLNDDNRLYRFSDGDGFFSLHGKSASRKPLSQLNDADDVRKTKYAKSKTVKDTMFRRRKSCIYKGSDGIAKTARLNAIGAGGFSKSLEAEEIRLTESEINDVWREAFIRRLQLALDVDNLDEMVLSQDVKGKWIRHNSTKLGKSGAVHVAPEQELPQWVLGAMACLANWPQEKSHDLPSYEGFGKDVFSAVRDYYCRGRRCSRSAEGPDENAIKSCATKPTDIPLEPLLTFQFFEIFTNILYLLEQENSSRAIEALNLCLLMLPPANRRKLHFLLKLMAKASTNPHLQNLSDHVSTRELMLKTFSCCILSYYEELDLDEILAMRLVSFLLDHHEIVMKVPENLIDEVEQKLEKLRKPVLFSRGSSADGKMDATELDCPASNVKSHGSLHRSKSLDAVKSLLTGIKSKSALPNGQENNKLSRRSHCCHKRSSSSTVGSDLGCCQNHSNDQNKSVKPAHSCPNINSTSNDKVHSGASFPQKTQEETNAKMNFKTLFGRFVRNR